MHFYEFDGTALNAVSTPASADLDSSYNINLLLLPTGEVLETDFSADIELYTPTGHARGSWKPQPEVCADRLRAGQNYTLRGRQLHGLSQGVAYGDDAQGATNYPIVRIKNRHTGHVAFARTFGFSSFSVARNAYSTATFQIPTGIETGPSDVTVIANGIASDSFRTTITH